MGKIRSKVLVLGDNDRAGLATVRSLSKAGLEVHVAAWCRHSPTRYSRHVSAIHRLGDPGIEPTAFAAALLDLANRVRFQVVIPTVESAILAIEPVVGEFRELTIYGAPPPPIFRTAYDKSVTMAIAGDCGFDVPRMCLIPQNCLKVLTAADMPASFPLILKPVHKGVIYKVNDITEVNERLGRMVQQYPVMIQEYCPGEGVAVDVLAENGDVLVAFQHERVHEPIGGGASSYRRSALVDNELLQLVKAFCRRVGWHGPAMFEFKTDRTCGRSALMEVNGRFWGSLALAINAGVDFPVLFYSMLTGKTVTQPRYKVPHYTRCLSQDIWWIINNFRSPNQLVGTQRVPLATVLGEFKNIFLLRESYDVERLLDPLPALHAWFQIISDGLKRARRRLGRRRATRADLEQV